MSEGPSSPTLGLGHTVMGRLLSCIIERVSITEIFPPSGLFSHTFWLGKVTSLKESHYLGWLLKVK